jgi:hypothetical protein
MNSCKLLLTASVFALTLSTIGNSAYADSQRYVALPDQYIITFRDDLSRKETLTLTRELTVRHRLRLRHTYKDSIRGFSAVFPAGKIEMLRNHPAVASIEQNGFWYVEKSAARIATIDAPTNVTATPVGDSQIDLAWTDNATTERGFEVFRSLTGIGGSYSRYARLRGANVTAYSDSQVTTGQEYCYQVSALESGAVSGPFSTGVCATIDDTPPTDAPTPPTGLSATTISDQRIDLAWIDQSDNESGFSVERATGAGGTFVEVDVVGSDATAFSDTGLAAQTEYCYQVRAYNAVGNSVYASIACSTTDDAGTTPEPLGAPTGLTASAPGVTAVELSWSDNATDEIGFDVHRSTNGINGTYNRLSLFRGANSSSYTDNTVAEDTEYCYKVRAAENRSIFGDFSVAACATPGSPPVTEPPAGPTALGTTAVNEQRIDLDWMDNADSESGFEVERALGASGTFVQIDVLGMNVQSYQDTALDAETEYCYRVRAFNDIGDSAYTATSCSMTLEEPPVGACTDTGNHDDLGNLWGISQIKADRNATWQGTQTAGCAPSPWFFGIDTGIDSDHTDLNVAEVMGFLAANPGNTGEDDHGHGTHTAGSAAAIDGNGGAVGVAPGALVHGFKVCDAGGSCAIDDIVAGVDEVTTRKLANPGQPMVANVSLGGGISSTSDSAIRRSVNAGVVYTISAGNGAFNACQNPVDSQNNSPARTGDDAINAQDGSDGDTARINGVITVTSSDSNDNDVNCNYGNPVTVAAPGDNIFSTWLSNGHATISGTSMAAPHVAGAAILYLHRNPDATPTEVEQAIVNELDPWTTDETPNADGRLDAETL